MKSYLIGKDTFSEDIEVVSSGGMLNGVKAFSRLLGGYGYYIACIVGLAAVGGLVLKLLASGPFLQFFYIQLLILGLFTLCLVFVMKGRLERNVLEAGRYRLEGDETQIRVFSTSTGTQRYGLSLIDRIDKGETGSEIVMNSGFRIPVSGLDLSLDALNMEKIPDQVEQGSIWFAEKAD